MSWGTGMRIEDWFHFRDAARLFKVWVLVRWTNPHSLEYVGRQTVKNTYIPKPIDCKPKTADRDAPGREHKGLVVDPVTVPDAISPSRRNKALSSWESFLGAQGAHDAPSLNARNLSTRTQPLVRQTSLGTIQHVQETRGVVDYQLIKNVRDGTADNSDERCYLVDLDPSSPHFGCLTLNGRYLHGDYDLKDIVRPLSAGRNEAVKEEMHGQPHMRSLELGPVQHFVNKRIGVPMVQHGGDAQYAAHESDTVEIFGPHGEAGTLVGLAQIQRWYQVAWQRRPISLSRQTLSRTIVPPSRVYRGATSMGIVHASLTTAPGGLTGRGRGRR